MKDELQSFYEGKDILITGGAGSIGSAILKQLLRYNPKRVKVLDLNEAGLFSLQMELSKHTNIRYLVGDIRDKSRLYDALRGVDIVFHAAALKHVPLCEYNPAEAVKTNVIGTQNLIEVARESDVGCFVGISTDKAVNPINTMGATKLLSEKLVINGTVGDAKTKFCCVRFGNVLNSSGSVVPLFMRQIKDGGPVTVTSKDMTRFCMSMEKAIQLVLKAAKMTSGREIFVIKMDNMRIIDLAEAMIGELAPRYGKNPKDIKVEYIGTRPGEKLHEQIMTEEEVPRAEEIDGLVVVHEELVLPHEIERAHVKKGLQGMRLCSKEGPFLTKDQIRSILKGI